MNVECEFAIDSDRAAFVRSPLPAAVAGHALKPFAIRLAHRLAMLRERDAREFLCVFSRETARGPETIVAIGSALEIDVRRDGDALHLALREAGRVLSSSRFTVDRHREFHRQVFDRLSTLVRQAGRHLADATLLGGWQCATHPDALARPARFTVPRIAIELSDAGGCVVATAADAGAAAAAIADALATVGDDAPAPGWRVRERTNVPDAPAYIDSLVAMIGELSGDARDKVVIGREVRLAIDGEVCPLALLESVARQQSNRYEYLFRWDDGDAWIGISPETLVRVSDGEVCVEPLAGTRKGSGAADRHGRYRAELLSDAKEIEEHETAARMFEDALGRVCVPGTLTVDHARDVLDLGYVQHLRSRMTGRLRANTDVFGVLAVVYPPATIWGKPVDLCGERLRRFEHIDRGFFTGGLGLFRPAAGDADFALVIRSARVTGREVRVYAGSGIVKGSDPYREWLETGNKMRPFLANAAFESI
ncbi:chorismate-binding protein [Burkholderia stagnalis]